MRSTHRLTGTASSRLRTGPKARAGPGRFNTVAGAFPAVPGSTLGQTRAAIRTLALARRNTESKSKASTAGRQAALH